MGTFGRICGSCGAHLDPGERCDCIEKAAFRGANTESGGKDQGIATPACALVRNDPKYDTAIIAEEEENVND